MFNSKKIGAGIIAIDKKTGDVLLGKRSINSDNPNSWAPFGGKFENKDITIKNCAKREFSEETGSDMTYQISSSPFAIQNTPKITFYTYVGVFNDKFHPQINKEHISFGWFPLEQLPNNLHPGFAALINNKKDEINNIIIRTKEDNEA